MQITNYWAQPQIPPNKAAASTASTMEFLNTAVKGSDSNNSGGASATQSAISGASPAANFSASLAATSVDTATTGRGTGANPDFTNMSDNQMWSWVNSQIASGSMTKDQADPYLTLASRTQDSPLLGGSTANATVPHNFIDEAQQYMNSEDHATARSIKPALDMMLKLQSQTSQEIGAALSLNDPAKQISTPFKEAYRPDSSPQTNVI